MRLPCHSLHHHRPVHLPLYPASETARLPTLPGRRPALVRLRGRENRAVRVRSCAVKSRAVSNRNCVVATRGGEQRNENDQSVTQIARVGGRRELDSVGVVGRVCERKTKPVKRTRGEEPTRRTAGPPPDDTLMVGDGMAGSSPDVIRETRRGQAVFRAKKINGPKSRPAGVRASVVATKRVTTVERRDVGKWMGNETERRLKIGASGGNASTSRRHPRPMGLGGTYGLDRVHVDAAHVG